MKKNERINLFFNESVFVQMISYTNSASIRFDLIRETETEPNEFRTNVDLPPATVSKSDQVLRFKGGKGGSLVNL